MLFYFSATGNTKHVAEKIKEPGAASSIADSLLKEKGLALDAKFDIRMPDTWTVIFDLSHGKR